MQIAKTGFKEHLAAKSRLPLVDFCEAVQRALNLPSFKYDAENECEWGISVSGGVEYNITRPYEVETLRLWDDTVPEGFNVGLMLFLPADNWVIPETSANIVREVGQSLSTALRTPFVHHRTWLGVGNSVARNAWFLPVQIDA